MEPVSPVMRDLAEKIYISLISGMVVVTEGNIQFQPDPESLGRLAFRLAAAFLRVEVDDAKVTAAAAAEKAGEAFDFKNFDMAAWKK